MRNKNHDSIGTDAINNVFCFPNNLELPSFAIVAQKFDFPWKGQKYQVCRRRGQTLDLGKPGSEPSKVVKPISRQNGRETTMLFAADSQASEARREMSTPTQKGGRVFTIMSNSDDGQDHCIALYWTGR